MSIHLNRLPRLLAFGAIAVALAGCAAQMAYRDGEKLVAEDKIEAGLVKYQEAIAADPGNAQYKAAFLRARDRNTTRLVEQAERELADGHADLALRSYRRALSIDPANERARAGLRQVEADARHAVLMEEATAAFERKDYELARQKLAAILTERPGHEPARLLMAQVVEKTAAPAADTGLAAAFKLPINIEFRDASLKQVFEVISRRSGLNFLFDKDVKTDQRTSIFLKNSTVEAAVYYLLVSNQLEQQVMDGNTILVYPNVAGKVKEYQEMAVKTFFLANADAKNVANTLKTILKSRDVVVDEKLNLVILRDSPEVIKLATRLVALQDVAEPEVMLDVEILEIKRSRLMDLGIAWPASVGFAPLKTDSGGAITIDTLRHLNGATIGVSNISLAVNANKTDGDSNTLANPRIRVRNREKAKVVIGDKVPNITTIITAGTGAGFASESINYVDVGLTLNVEPTIYLNNEVAIRISLEVSNLVDSITTKSGSVAYRIGTRSATTMLQLKDGENQVLAGLINNEDRTSGSKVPGVGNLPILGRLFGSTRDSTDKTEIVLSITPHLVRNIQRPAVGVSEFNAGTETSFRRRPETVPVPVKASAPAPALPAPVAPQPAPAPTPAPTPAPAPATTVVPLPAQ
ncbi:secretin N-terminal domain-containing protein [Massilia sp. R2A-15]|uniref:secretin N-terminal domain-containing protein n=1 Tax=Massilia sp. R2A-15 TaxID=3064278 RepID=UPI002734B4B0|nr:secretin N-terminal domain-containing protein [Massilia sp. R2A-15]WLI90268.1 secretin N-terminal domain-containing protein [Massilia sp. R2A-15]